MYLPHKVCYTPGSANADNCLSLHTSQVSQVSSLESNNEVENDDAQPNPGMNEMKKERTLSFSISLL